VLSGKRDASSIGSWALSCRIKRHILVFLGAMQPRFRTFAALAAVGAALCVPAAANAEVYDLGMPSSGTGPGDQSSVPACPDTDGAGKDSICQVVTRTTAYQAKVGSTKNYMVVPKSGRIVAWSVTLAKPSADEISFFSDKGTVSGVAKAGLGVPSAGIAVLRPGKKKKSISRVLANSPVYDMTPYLGKTVQFPLTRSIPVTKGYIVALNVPSWAPVLALGQPGTSSWRASRPKGRCGTDTNAAGELTDTAALFVPSTVKLNVVGDFGCLYGEAQLTYSATVVTSASPKPKVISSSGSTTPVSAEDDTTTVDDTTDGEVALRKAKK
jgi:hypothetical protein